MSPGPVSYKPSALATSGVVYMSMLCCFNVYVYVWSANAVLIVFFSLCLFSILILSQGVLVATSLLLLMEYKVVALFLSKGEKLIYMYIDYGFFA